MKCIKCGKRLKKNEKFCTYCGYYNDTEEKENWNTDNEEEDLLEENWYDDDFKSEEDEVVIESPKKEKKKKEKKEKPKKEDKPVKEETPKKVKKEKEITEVKFKEDNEIYDENERYLEAYIGEDYRLIKKSPFNIYAFILNWMYFLYRKLYITGIIGLIITALVAFFFTKYFLIYLIITLIVLGIGFNPYYIFISKRKVNKILNDYEGSDSFSLEKTCEELGGVNVVFSLIIYLIFLIIIIVSIVKVNINTDHNTNYWKENSENNANCGSLARLAYREEKNNYKKIEEALCKVNKNSKNYEIYLKTIKNKKTVYVYYETKDNYIVYKNNTEYLDMLTNKKKNKTITKEEEKVLNDIKMIESNYKSIKSKSLDEDKQIKNKTNREEKLNYIINYEEIIR